MVRGSFVSSIDGASSVDGISGGLSSHADKAMFRIQRELTDLVVIGSGTAKAENYFGVRSDQELEARRRAQGLSAVPPIAVLSSTADLDPDSQLFTNTFVPPIVITTDAAPKTKTKALESAGAVVIHAGTSRVNVKLALTSLSRLGFVRILCEGGPKLFGSMLAEDLVDDVCLTLSPSLVGGRAGRIADWDGAAASAMSLAHVLVAEDGTLLTRWVRQA
ncbi:pyrimidine reductase family protein [Rhodococcus sp. SBT000017]|uniref:pyrimidine reductase family protein n=1 Tax=Rhodococcus sp. SBT000017 TaxID=1803385 RepID=UPI000EF8F228|nr:pyrimidine reductase family protein [Rhodococcus sp. SBT000017]RMB75985.1 pyrimidine reductase family protein [Rhodococcus sp. SBT000017]